MDRVIHLAFALVSLTITGWGVYYTLFLDSTMHQVTGLFILSVGLLSLAATLADHYENH